MKVYRRRAHVRSCELARVARTQQKKRLTFWGQYKWTKKVRTKAQKLGFGQVIEHVHLGCPKDTTKSVIEISTWRGIPPHDLAFRKGKDHGALHGIRAAPNTCFLASGVY